VPLLLDDPTERPGWHVLAGMGCGIGLSFLGMGL